MDTVTLAAIAGGAGFVLLLICAVLIVGYIRRRNQKAEVKKYALNHGDESSSKS